MKLNRQVLQVDVAGNPAAWINVREAVRHHVVGNVICELGQENVTVLGGHNAITGRRSQLAINSILMVKGRVNGRVQTHDYVPPFSRDLVILRDRQMCMYCGNQFRVKDLTIDHVVPQAQDGETSFKNCVCSCKRCNNLKGNRTPEQWGHHLLAVPYEINYAERLFLVNRHIIYDQTEFLVKRFRKNSSLKSLIT